MLAGCGEHITFEKVDLKGHVRVAHEDQGYCFRVPEDWEIREKLEDADVVSLAPPQDGFRDSIVAKIIAAKDLEDPEQTLRNQMAPLGDAVTVVEPWVGPDTAVVVTLEERKLSKYPLGQLLFLHLLPSGDGVLITCTTKQDRLSERRDFFSQVVNEAKYDLSDCNGPGILPKVYPTPEVTMSPLSKTP